LLHFNSVSDRVTFLLKYTVSGNKRPP